MIVEIENVKRCRNFKKNTRLLDVYLSFCGKCFGTEIDVKATVTAPAASLAHRQKETPGGNGRPFGHLLGVPGTATRLAQALAEER